MAALIVMPRSGDMNSNSAKALHGHDRKLKLLGEHETYKWEYDICLEKMALLQRLLDKKQEARLHSSSIKASP